MRRLLILFGVLTYNIMSAQVSITTDTTSDKFKIQESTYITDMPLGSVYVDVNSSGHIGLKILGTDKLIVGYKTPSTYTINGVLQSNKDTCVKYLSLATSLQLEYLISNISGGGGENIYTTDGTSSEPRESYFPYGLVLGKDLNTTLLYFGEIDSKDYVALSSDGNLDLLAGDTVKIQTNGKLIKFSDGADDFTDDLNIQFYQLPIENLDSINYVYVEHNDGLLKRVPLDSFKSGGGSSLYAGNGILIENDTIKLDSVISQNTHIELPNNTSYQIGNNGNAVNLNVDMPIEYSGLASTYTGFDYVASDSSWSAFTGVLKGVIFPMLGFDTTDLVGTFTTVGDPFNPIYPDGSIMVNGVYNDEGDVAQKSIVLTFLGADLSINLISQIGVEQSFQLVGNNATQSQSIDGDNSTQSHFIKGDNSTQSHFIKGDNSTQSQSINGDNSEQSVVIIGDNSIYKNELFGSGNTIQRKISDSTTSELFQEIITDTKYSSTVDTFEVNADVINLNGALYLNRETVNDSTLTLGANKSVYVWNIPNPSAEATLNFPSTPLDGMFFRVIIGATDTLGHTISNVVSFVSSDTLFFLVPSELKCGEVYEFQYFLFCNCWYQIK